MARNFPEPFKLSLPLLLPFHLENNFHLKQLWAVDSKILRENVGNSFLDAECIPSDEIKTYKYYGNHSYYIAEQSNRHQCAMWLDASASIKAKSAPVWSVLVNNNNSSLALIEELT